MGESESADERGSRRRSSKRFRWRSRRDARERSVESSGESSADEREAGSRTLGSSRREREAQQTLATIGDSGNEAGSSNDEAEERQADLGQRAGSDAEGAGGTSVAVAAGGATSVGPSSAAQGAGAGEAVLVVRGLTVEVDLAGGGEGGDSRSETTSPAATPDRVGDFSPGAHQLELVPARAGAGGRAGKGGSQQAGLAERQMVSGKGEKGGKNTFRLAALLWGNGDVALARLKKLEQEAAAKGREGILLSPTGVVRATAHQRTPAQAGPEPAQGAHSPKAAQSS